MNTNINELSGYITNLGKYNEGYLIGEWIKFPISEDELEAVLERIGINDEYEEYFITDYDNYYDIDFDFGEYTSISRINETVEALDNLSSYELEKVKAILEVEHMDVLDVIENLNRWGFYQGADKEDIAREHIETYFYSGEIPEFFQTYFDYEGYARDYLCDYSETSYGVIWEA